MVDALLNRIPMASLMGLGVVDLGEEGLAISAPLAPNRNDKGMVFAGSLYSAMVLTGWTYLSWRLKREAVDAEVVVTAAEIAYLKPVRSDFVSVCRIPDTAGWDHFRAKLEKRKNYRIHLPVEISINGELKARLNGEYFAWLKRPEPQSA